MAMPQNEADLARMIQGAIRLNAKNPSDKEVDYIKDQLGIGSYTNYFPSWTSTGTQPALGNGSLQGAYARIGKVIVVQAVLQCGSTTTYGTGSYAFSVPVPGINLLGNGTGDFYGGGIVYNAGGANANLVRWRPDGQVVLNQLTFSYIGQGTPITFASGSIISLNQTYIAA